MRDRSRDAVLGLAVLLAGIFSAASPPTVTEAGATTAGAWSGVLTLNTYPCATSCFGTFSASLVGQAVGTDEQGHPFTVIWPDPTANPVPAPVNLTASFDYSEQCPVGETGSAGGTYTLAGGYVDDNGSIYHDGTLTGAFDWLRIGTAFGVTTSAGRLTAGGAVIAQQAIPPGAGAGTFVPDPPATDNCLPGGIGTLTVQVTGGYGSPQ